LIICEQNHERQYNCPYIRELKKTHLEVLLQPVPDEDTPGVDEVPQLEVRVLQFHDVVLSERGILIAGD
jgi:hypothetical protein